jgi:hypothetical protein
LQTHGSSKEGDYGDEDEGEEDEVVVVVVVVAVNVEKDDGPDAGGSLNDLVSQRACCTISSR